MNFSKISLGRENKVEEDEIYTGEFLGGKKNGKGVLYVKLVRKYEGEWKDNFKDGKGVMYFDDGSVFRGRFERNLIDGIGELTDKNGKKTEGLFVLVDYGESIKLV